MGLWCRPMWLYVAVLSLLFVPSCRLRLGVYAQTVLHVSSNDKAYVAVFDDGTVRSWGDTHYGGYGNEYFLNNVKNVSRVYGNGMAFAAILRPDGRVVTWGDASSGGDSSSVAADLVGIAKIFSTRRAFAALSNSGKIVTWGYGPHGGDSSAVVDLLQSGVSTVCSNDVAFIAVKYDGAVVSWPIYNEFGGNSTSVMKDLVNIASCGTSVATVAGDDPAEGVPSVSYSQLPRDCSYVLVSGLYYILPTGNIKGATPIRVFCDLDTPGGPWMLTYAYKHVRGQDNLPVSGVIPLDPTSGYSHVDVKDIPGFSKQEITAVRFFCRSSSHNRTVSFYTSNDAVRDIAWGATDGVSSRTLATDWSSGWVNLPGHSAHLPAETDVTGSTTNYLDVPFSRFGKYRWTVYGNDRTELPLTSSGFDYFALSRVVDVTANSKPLTSKPLGLFTPGVVTPTSSPVVSPSQPRVILKIDSAVANLKIGEIVVMLGAVKQVDFRVYASSNEDKAGLAIDGDVNTYWRSNLRDPEPWIALDLTGIPFDSLLVKPVGYHPNAWSPSEIQITLASSLVSGTVYWAADFRRGNAMAKGYYRFSIETSPTFAPTAKPTKQPVRSPTPYPTFLAKATRSPTTYRPTPSSMPTAAPTTKKPVASTTTASPTNAPIAQPTRNPTTFGTGTGTAKPTVWSMVFSYSYSSAQKPTWKRITGHPTKAGTRTPPQPVTGHRYLRIDHPHKPGGELDIADLALYKNGLRLSAPLRVVAAKGCSTAYVQANAPLLFDQKANTSFRVCEPDAWLSVNVTGVAFDRVEISNRYKQLQGYSVTPGRMFWKYDSSSKTSSMAAKNWWRGLKMNSNSELASPPNSSYLYYPSTFRNISTEDCLSQCNSNSKCVGFNYKRKFWSDYGNNAQMQGMTTDQQFQCELVLSGFSTTVLKYAYSSYDMLIHGVPVQNLGLELYSGLAVKQTHNSLAYNKTASSKITANTTDEISRANVWAVVSITNSTTADGYKFWSRILDGPPNPEPHDKCASREGKAAPSKWSFSAKDVNVKKYLRIDQWSGWSDPILAFTEIEFWKNGAEVPLYFPASEFHFVGEKDESDVGSFNLSQALRGREMPKGDCSVSRYWVREKGGAPLPSYWPVTSATAQNPSLNFVGCNAAGAYCDYHPDNPGTLFDGFGGSDGFKAPPGTSGDSNYWRGVQPGYTGVDGGYELTTFAESMYVGVGGKFGTKGYSSRENGAETSNEQRSRYPGQWGYNSYSYSDPNSNYPNPGSPWIYMDITGLDFDTIKLFATDNKAYQAPPNWNTGDTMNYKCSVINARVTIKTDPDGNEDSVLWSTYLSSPSGGTEIAEDPFLEISGDYADSRGSTECPDTFTLATSKVEVADVGKTRAPTPLPILVRGTEFLRIDNPLTAPLQIAEIEVYYRGNLLSGPFAVYGSPSFLSSSTDSRDTSKYLPDSLVDGDFDTYYLSSQSSRSPWVALELTTRRYDKIVVYTRSDGVDREELLGARVAITSDLAGTETPLWATTFDLRSTNSGNLAVFTFIPTGPFLSVNPMTYAPSPAPRRRLMSTEADVVADADADADADVDTMADIRRLDSVTSISTSSSISEGILPSRYNLVGKSLVALYPGQDFTVQAWVYSQGYLQSSTSKAPLFATGSLDSGSGMMLRISKIAGVELLLNRQYVSGGQSEVVENIWQHVAVIRCNGLVTVYLDGQKVGGAKRWAMQESLPRGTTVTVGGNPDMLSERLFGYAADVRMSLLCERSTNFDVPLKPSFPLDNANPQPTASPTPSPTAKPTEVIVLPKARSKVVLVAPTTMAPAEIVFLYKQRTVKIDLSAVTMQGLPGYGAAKCFDGNLTTYCQTDGVHKIAIDAGQATFDQVKVYYSPKTMNGIKFMLKVENGTDSGIYLSVYNDTMKPRLPWSVGTPYTSRSAYIFDINCPGNTSSATGLQPCKACPEFTYNWNISSTTCDSAEYCALNTFNTMPGRSPGPGPSGDRNDACAYCTRGTYQQYRGGPCVATPPGKYISDYVAGNHFFTPQNCAAGTYSSSGGMVGSCTSCPAGASSGEGATSCEPSPPGKFYSTVLGSAQPCPPGTFATGYSVYSCLPCWDGYTTFTFGNTQCVPVPAGYHTVTSPPTYLAPFAKTVMAICPRGYYSTNAASACTPCATGYYADLPGSATCKPSQVNKFPTAHLATVKPMPPPVNLTAYPPGDVIGNEVVWVTITPRDPSISALKGDYKFSGSNVDSSDSTTGTIMYAFDGDSSTAVRTPASKPGYDALYGRYTGSTQTDSLARPLLSESSTSPNVYVAVPTGWAFGAPVTVAPYKLLGSVNLPLRYTLTFGIMLTNADTSVYYSQIDVLDLVSPSSSSVSNKFGIPRVQFTAGTGSVLANKIISNYLGTGEMYQSVNATGDFASQSELPRKKWVRVSITIDRLSLKQTITQQYDAGLSTAWTMQREYPITVPAGSWDKANVYAGGVFKPGYGATNVWDDLAQRSVSLRDVSIISADSLPVEVTVSTSTSVSTLTVSSAAATCIKTMAVVTSSGAGASLFESNTVVQSVTGTTVTLSNKPTTAGTYLITFTNPTSTSSVLGEWVQFRTPGALIPQTYTITVPPSLMLTKWSVLASTDGVSNWLPIGQVASFRREFCPPSTSSSSATTIYGNLTDNSYYVPNAEYSFFRLVVQGLALRFTGSVEFKSKQKADVVVDAANGRVTYTRSLTSTPACDSDSENCVFTFKYDSCGGYVQVSTGNQGLTAANLIGADLLSSKGTGLSCIGGTCECLGGYDFNSTGYCVVAKNSSLTSLLSQSPTAKPTSTAMPTVKPTATPTFLPTRHSDALHYHDDTYWPHHESTDDDYHLRSDGWRGPTSAPTMNTASRFSEGTWIQLDLITEKSTPMYVSEFSVQGLPVIVADTAGDSVGDCAVADGYVSGLLSFCAPQVSNLYLVIAQPRSYVVGGGTPKILINEVQFLKNGVAINWDDATITTSANPSKKENIRSKLTTAFNPSASTETASANYYDSLSIGTESFIAVDVSSLDFDQVVVHTYDRNDEVQNMQISLASSIPTRSGYTVYATRFFDVKAQDKYYFDFFCPAGTYSSSGHYPCIACPQGTMAPNTGSKLCTPVAAGFSSNIVLSKTWPSSDRTSLIGPLDPGSATGTLWGEFDVKYGSGIDHEIFFVEASNLTKSSYLAGPFDANWMTTFKMSPSYRNSAVKAGALSTFNASAGSYATTVDRQFTELNNGTILYGEWVELTFPFTPRLWSYTIDSTGLTGGGIPTKIAVVARSTVSQSSTRDQWQLAAYSVTSDPPPSTYTFSLPGYNNFSEYRFVFLQVSVGTTGSRVGVQLGNVSFNLDIAAGVLQQVCSSGSYSSYERTCTLCPVGQLSLTGQTQCSFGPDGAAPSSKLIDDDLSETGLQSLNTVFATKLALRSYAGPLFSFRRSTDNAEGDFYANTRGGLGTLPAAGGTPLSTWKGSSLLYVKVWYDQSLNANHAVQLNTTLQPVYDFDSRSLNFTGGRYLNTSLSAFPSIDSSSYSFVFREHSIPVQVISYPTMEPTGQPTSRPSGQPSVQPSGSPTRQPAARPSGQPSRQPTSNPSSPTGQPTVRPTKKPVKPTARRLVQEEDEVVEETLATARRLMQEEEKETSTAEIGANVQRKLAVDDSGMGTVTDSAIFVTGNSTGDISIGYTGPTALATYVARPSAASPWYLTIDSLQLSSDFNYTRFLSLAEIAVYNGSKRVVISSSKISLKRYSPYANATASVSSVSAAKLVDGNATTGFSMANVSVRIKLDNVKFDRIVVTNTMSSCSYNSSEEVGFPGKALPPPLDQGSGKMYSSVVAGLRVSKSPSLYGNGEYQVEWSDATDESPGSNAFDSDMASIWQTTTQTYSPNTAFSASWITLKVPQAMAVTGYSFTCPAKGRQADLSPRSVKLYGSPNGTTWILIDKPLGGVSNSTIRLYPSKRQSPYVRVYRQKLSSPSTVYSYFKLEGLPRNRTATSFAIGDVKLFSVVSGVVQSRAVPMCRKRIAGARISLSTESTGKNPFWSERFDSRGSVEYSFSPFTWKRYLRITGLPATQMYQAPNNHDPYKYQYYPLLIGEVVFLLNKVPVNRTITTVTSVFGSADKATGFGGLRNLFDGNTSTIWSGVSLEAPYVVIDISGIVFDQILLLSPPGKYSAMSKAQVIISEDVEGTFVFYNKTLGSEPTSAYILEGPFPLAEMGAKYQTRWQLNSPFPYTPVYVVYNADLSTTDASYVTIPSRSTFAIGRTDSGTTGIFTMEAWVKGAAPGVMAGVFRFGTAKQGFSLIILDGLRLVVRSNSLIDGSQIVSPTFRETDWVHVALTRRGSLFSVFWNGTRIGFSNSNTTKTWSFAANDIFLGTAEDFSDAGVQETAEFTGTISDFAFYKDIKYGGSAFTPPLPGWTSNQTVFFGPARNSLLQADTYFAQTVNGASGRISAFINSANPQYVDAPVKPAVKSPSIVIGASANVSLFSFITANSELSATDVAVLGTLSPSTLSAAARAVSGSIYLRIDQRNKGGKLADISIADLQLSYQGVSVSLTGKNVVSAPSKNCTAKVSALTDGNATTIFKVCSKVNAWFYVDVTGLVFDQVLVVTRNRQWTQYASRGVTTLNGKVGKLTAAGATNTFVSIDSCKATCDAKPGCTGFDFCSGVFDSANNFVKSDSSPTSWCIVNDFSLSDVTYLREGVVKTDYGAMPWDSCRPHFKANDTSTIAWASISLTNTTDGSYSYWNDLFYGNSTQLVQDYHSFAFSVPSTLAPSSDFSTCPPGQFSIGSNCVICPLNFYKNQGDLGCLYLDAGQYSVVPSSVSFTLPPAFTGSSTAGATSLIADYPSVSVPSVSGGSSGATFATIIVNNAGFEQFNNYTGGKPDAAAEYGEGLRVNVFSDWIATWKMQFKNLVAGNSWLCAGNLPCSQRTLPGQGIYVAAFWKLYSSLAQDIMLPQDVSTLQVFAACNFRAAADGSGDAVFTLGYGLNGGGAVISVYLAETNAEGEDSYVAGSEDSSTYGTWLGDLTVIGSWKLYETPAIDVSAFAGTNRRLRFVLTYPGAKITNDIKSRDIMVFMDSVSVVYLPLQNNQGSSVGSVAAAGLPSPSSILMVGGTYNVTMSSISATSSVGNVIDGNMLTGASFGAGLYSTSTGAYTGSSKTSIGYSLRCLKGRIKSASGACKQLPSNINGEWIQIEFPAPMFPTAFSFMTPPGQTVSEMWVLGSSDGKVFVTMNHKEGAEIYTYASMPLHFEAFGYDKWYAPKFLRLVVVKATLPTGTDLKLLEFNVGGYPYVPSTTRIGGHMNATCALGRVLQSDWTCFPCPKGTKHNVTESTCDACPAGSYANALSGATLCLPCPSGYSSVDASTSCKVCPLGYFVKVSGGLCVPVDPGYFAPYQVTLPSISLLGSPVKFDRDAAKRNPSVTVVNSRSVTPGVYPGYGYYEVVTSQKPSAATLSDAERSAILSMFDKSTSTAFGMNTIDAYENDGTYKGVTRSTYTAEGALSSFVLGEWIEIKMPMRMILDDNAFSVQTTERGVNSWLLLGAMDNGGLEFIRSSRGSRWSSPSLCNRFRLVLAKLNAVTTSQLSQGLTLVKVPELAFTGNVELGAIMYPWRGTAVTVVQAQCPMGYTSTAGSTMCSRFIPLLTKTFFSVGQVESFVVPEQYNFVQVKLWGAGGAGSGVELGNDQATMAGFGGGSGGYTGCFMPVTPGEVLKIIVGGGGYATPFSSKKNAIFTGLGGFSGGGNATFKSNPLSAEGQLSSIGSGGGMTAIRRLLKPAGRICNQSPSSTSPNFNQPEPVVWSAAYLWYTAAPASYQRCTATSPDIWDYAAVAGGGGGAGIGNSTFKAGGRGGVASLLSFDPNVVPDPSVAGNPDVESIRRYVNGGSGVASSVSSITTDGGSGGGAGYPGGKAGRRVSKYHISGASGGANFLGPASIGCVRETAVTYSGTTGMGPLAPGSTSIAAAPYANDNDYSEALQRGNNFGGGGGITSMPTSVLEPDSTWARGGDGLAVLTFTYLAGAGSGSGSSSSSSASRRLLPAGESAMIAAEQRMSDEALAVSRAHPSSAAAAVNGPSLREVLAKLDSVGVEELSAAELAKINADLEANWEAELARQHSLVHEQHHEEGAERVLEPARPSQSQTQSQTQAQAQQQRRNLNQGVSEPFQGTWETPPAPAPSRDRPSYQPTVTAGLPTKAPQRRSFSMFSGYSIVYSHAGDRTLAPTRPRSELSPFIHAAAQKPKSQARSRFECDDVQFGSKQYAYDTLHQVWVRTSGNQAMSSRTPTLSPTRRPTAGPTLATQYPTSSSPTGTPTDLSPTPKPSSAPSQAMVSRQFSFTGSAQSFVVPAGVKSIWVDVYGAQGGGAVAVKGGKGAHIRALLVVTPGSMLQINVGGAGGAAFYDPSASGLFTATGGWNGGGFGGLYPVDVGTPLADLIGGGGGGGASDVRIGGTAISNRVVVGGGGGGALITSTWAMQYLGGSGGTEFGGDGDIGRKPTAADTSKVAGGGKPNGGGAGANAAPDGSCQIVCTANADSLKGFRALGGGKAAIKSNNACSGGGGGGGQFGGGAGCLSGGAGGSSFASSDPTVKLLEQHEGVNAGHGRIVVSWLS